MQDFFRFNYVAGGSANLANAPFVSISEADNLLILSLGSNLLLEVTRSGQIVSSLNLAGISQHNAIEGLTIDENGVIYLVAEHEQDGSTTDPHSRLIVLSPVPVPGTLALMFGGLGVLGCRARRRC